MWRFVIMLAASTTATDKPWHPAVDQATLWQIKKNSPVDLMCVSSGAAISYCQANSSLDKPLIQNTFFMDQITNQVRERTVGRPVHRKASGAFGYFEVTHDISHICKASFLEEVGKRTPVAARFSSAIAENGGSDLMRDIRGFALKFYTDEGNFDIPGIVTPIFPFKNPVYYVKFIYAITKSPDLYLFDPKSMWEFIIKHPESMYTFMYMFADRGIPASYRHMPCYNVHSLQVENKCGEQYFIRFHVEPVAGIQHLETAEAQKINAQDPDYFKRDLYDSIKKGDFPSWIVSVQIVNEADVQRCGYRVFDISRTLPKKEFPLHPVGKIVLNRNPVNYFAEVDQIVFNPSNLVRGILGAPDKVYEARRFAYSDAQLHRLGPEVNKIPVNCPLHVSNDHSESSTESIDCESIPKRGLLKIKEEQPYNFDQARELYENEMTSAERGRLHENLKLGLAPAPKDIREKVLEILEFIHPDLANTIAQMVNTPTTQ